MILTRFIFIQIFSSGKPSVVSIFLMLFTLQNIQKVWSWLSIRTEALECHTQDCTITPHRMTEHERAYWSRPVKCH